MSNTLTNLQPDLYEALDTVSRELVGFIPSVTLDSGVERAAVGQNIRSFVTPASESQDITPGVTVPNDGDQEILNQTMTISKAKGIRVRWNGEEQRGLNTGGGYNPILRDQFAQAMRTLTNEIESDLAGLYSTMSRAHGTAGTTPFASTLTDSAQVRKILADNGAPLTDMQLVIDTTAGAKMRTLTNLTKANEAADSSLLRQGILLDVHGMQIRESAQIGVHTAGTVTDDPTVTGVEPIGETTINVTTDAGDGVALLKGDAITIAGDTNKYIVAADVTIGVSTTGDILIQEPGLRQATAGAEAVSVGAAYTPNMAFSRSAIVLATRAPARPSEGDMAEDVMIITDPRSGLAFEIALYKQYRQISYEVSMAWGWKNFKTEHTAILLG